MMWLARLCIQIVLVSDVDIKHSLFLYGVCYFFHARPGIVPQAEAMTVLICTVYNSLFTTHMIGTVQSHLLNVPLLNYSVGSRQLLFHYI